ncbi:MAG: rhomboid family intramembrane serine protease [Ramlibacter sp.]
MPPVTLNLLIANVAAFVLLPTVAPGLFGWLALWPLESGRFAPWQLVSYSFLHGGLAHLAFNMFGLWMFGAELEQVWGPRRFATFYFCSVLAAAVTQMAVSQFSGSTVPTVGASGGLFGLLVGFAIVFPQRRITPLFPPIPMPAPVFVALYGGIELLLGVTGSASGIAHFAHLGGIAGGWLVLRYWRGLPPFSRRH